MNPEEELRLECLRIVTQHCSAAHRPSDIVKAASDFYDFVTGKDRASAVEAAKAAVDALR